MRFWEGRLVDIDARDEHTAAQVVAAVEAGSVIQFRLLVADAAVEDRDGVTGGALVNVIAALARDAARHRRGEGPAEPIDPDGAVEQRRIRDVDRERVMRLLTAVTDAIEMPEQRRDAVWTAAFFEAMTDTYGPAGRFWAVQNVLTLAIGWLSGAVERDVARDEADAMTTLQQALDDIDVPDLD